jgi:hypothetical protein
MADTQKSMVSIVAIIAIVVLVGLVIYFVRQESGNDVLEIEIGQATDAPALVMLA